MEVLIKNLNKVVNSLEVVKIVVIDINTNTKVESSISSIHNLEISELNKICVFCISHGDN